MKLYVFPIAPNPTKVRLYLAEKAAAGRPIPLEQVTVSLIEGEHRQAAHRARNPFATLPVLETDGGRFVIESLPIIDYLEELHPEPSMFGPDPDARVFARQLERVADIGVLIPIGRIVHATNSPVGYPPNPAVADYYRERLPRSLDYLEDQLADGRAWLAGDRVTVADCTLASALQFGRFRKIEPVSEREYPRLADWDARYRGRAVAKAVLLV
ncbi:MAG: glutathione S-transferase family protein [Myxococcota bacterium]